RIERAADPEPPVVAFPVAGEEGALRLAARLAGGAEAVAREVPQRGVQHAVVAARRAVVVRSGGGSAALENPRERRVRGRARGCEAECHAMAFHQAPAGAVPVATCDGTRARAPKRAFGATVS